MKLKNGEIFAAIEPLASLSKIQLPIVVAWKIVMLAGKLKTPYNDIVTVKDGLIKKYGKKGENGQFGVEPANENWAKFIAEYDELMDIETEIVIDKVHIPSKVDDKTI